MQPMKKYLNKIKYILFLLVIILHINIGFLPAKIVSASEIKNNNLIEKISSDYTKKFCNSIGFGLSKESAMDFSIEENKQVFKKKKGINSINKELLAEEISISVIEKCGYPINLSGEKGILEFKNYYLSKDK